MELQTHNPQHVYTPAWGSAPPTPQNWSEGSLAKLYDKDLCAWANTNAQLLREQRYDKADIEHLIEELDDMGSSHRQAIESYLCVLLTHLLKWQFQADHRTSGWRGSIVNSRLGIAKQIRRYPSLHSMPAQALEEEYEDARQVAIAETGLPDSVFPETCPYSLAQILANGWLPE